MISIVPESITSASVSLRRNDGATLFPRSVAVRANPDGSAQAEFSFDWARLSDGHWDVVFLAGGAVDVEGNTNTQDRVLYSFPVNLDTLSVVPTHDGRPVYERNEIVTIKFTAPPNKELSSNLRYSVGMADSGSLFSFGGGDIDISVSIGSFRPGNYFVTVAGAYVEGTTWEIRHEFSVKYADPTLSLLDTYELGADIPTILIIPDDSGVLTPATIAWVLTGVNGAQLGSGDGSTFIALPQLNNAGEHRLTVTGEYDTGQAWSISQSFDVTDPATRPYLQIYDRARPSAAPWRGGYTYVTQSNYADFLVESVNGTLTGIEVSYGETVITQTMRRADGKWQFRVYTVPETTKEISVIGRLQEGGSLNLAFNLEYPGLIPAGIHSVVKSETNEVIANGETIESEDQVSISWRVGNADPSRTLVNLVTSIGILNQAPIASSGWGTNDEIAAVQTFSAAIERGTEANQFAPRQWEWVIRANYEYEDGTDEFTHRIIYQLPPPNQPAAPSLFVQQNMQVGLSGLITWSDAEPTRTQVSNKLTIDSGAGSLVLAQPTGTTSHSFQYFPRRVDEHTATLEITYTDGTTASVSTHFTPIMAPAPANFFVYYKSETEIYAQWQDPGVASDDPDNAQGRADGYLLKAEPGSEETTIQWDLVEIHPVNRSYRVATFAMPDTQTTYQMRSSWGGSLTEYSNTSTYTPPRQTVLSSLTHTSTAPTDVLATVAALDAASTFQDASQAAGDLAFDQTNDGRSAEAAVLNSIIANTHNKWATVEAATSDPRLKAIAQANAEVASGHVDNLIRFYESRSSADEQLAISAFEAWERYSTYALTLTTNTLISFNAWVEAGEPTN